MLPAHSVVVELQDRIEQLSSTIGTVKQLLHDLEEQRIQARRRLNSLRDPMARLPLELQLQIFLDVRYDCGEPSMSPGNVPMIFLGICERWRGIALSTPRLWTTISMTGLPRTVGYTTLAETWIERAQTLPLSLSLEGRLRPLDDNVQELLTRYRRQVRTLTLTVKIEDSGASSVRDEYFFDIEGPFSSLEKLTVLSKQKIYSDGVVDELLDVLRTAPGLSHCVMVNMLSTWDVVKIDPVLEPFTLPSLETLELGDIDAFTYRGIQNNSASILLYFTLPALKTLRLAALDTSYDDFISFLTRSSPPLESVELSLRCIWPQHWLNRVLRVMPTLQCLTLTARSDDVDDGCLRRSFDALTTPPTFSPICANLLSRRSLQPMSTTKRSSACSMLDAPRIPHRSNASSFILRRLTPALIRSRILRVSRSNLRCRSFRTVE